MTETMTQEKDEATVSVPTPAPHPEREIFSQQTDLRGKGNRDLHTDTEPNAAWPPKLGPPTNDVFS